MKKKIIILAMLLVVIFTFSYVKNIEAAMTKTTTIQQYQKAAKKIEKKYRIKATDSAKLTYKKITHRKNRVIVERCIGKVANNQRDGKLLNGNGYISYRTVKCQKGNIVATYLLYNPENNSPDDIIARWDFVIKK